MSKPRELILHIPESVKEDTLGYRSQVKKFFDGQTSPVAFRAYRVPMGVYEQRTAGKFMVRIRIGAGLVLPYQLERIAQLSKSYGNGIVHVTTRQDIQIHEVNIEDTPDVLEGLLEVGLSPRGGGGNTVRNVTACSRAGVCPKEEFDVAPFAIATAEYLLQSRSSFNLPRKYKIVFSGCSDDCAFASVADLGFFAHTKNGAKGFSVYAAGGLGSNPAVAVKIEDFIEDKEVFEVAEAIKRLFDKYGDRANKHKARLRYVLARDMADAISNKFRQASFSANLSETTIKISGCPNSCGHHYIADIGLQGRAKRVNGKLMPCYDVLVGAKTVEGYAHLAESIGTVPAKKIPELLAEAFEGDEVKEEKLKGLVERYADFSSTQFPDDYYYDFGSDEPFSLAGRGPGECGAGVMDVIKLDIDEAKDALKSAPANSENIYKAIVATARALLVTLGLEPKKDREIFAAFTRHLIEPGWVKPQTQQLLDDTIDWRMGDRESIDDLLPQVGELTKRVEELFLSLDANLQFKAEPFVQQDDIGKANDKGFIIDLRGVECPLNFVKAKLELEKIAVGHVLEVLLDDGEPVRNAPASFAEQGQEVIEIKNKGNHFCVKVRRKK